MDQNSSDKLINEIGSMILSSDRYQGVDWDAIAIVATISEFQKNFVGYIYSGENFQAETPGLARPLGGLLLKLQEFTRSPSGEVWKQALIHITKPGPEIRFQLEYDDPKRWKMKKVSLDMSDYANSLRPPSKETAGN